MNGNYFFKRSKWIKGNTFDPKEIGLIHFREKPINFIKQFPKKIFSMKLISSLFFLFFIYHSQAQTDTTLYGWIDSTTYREVEVTAPFFGGLKVWEAYLKKQLKYPKAAKGNKIQGTVVIEFTINVNSTVSDLKVFKSVEKSLDEEALRLIRHGLWVPAIQNGRQVNYRARREIEFRLK